MSNVLQRLSVPHCRGGVKVSFLLSGIYRLYNRFGSAVYVSQRGMCRRSVLYAIKQTLTTLKPHRFEAFIHNIVTFSLRYNNQNDGLSFTPPVRQNRRVVKSSLKVLVQRLGDFCQC